MRFRSYVLSIALLVAACGEHGKGRQDGATRTVVDAAQRNVDVPAPRRAPRRPWSASYEGLGWLGRRQALDGGWEEGADAHTATTDDPYLTGLVAVTHLLNGWNHRGHADTGEVMRRAMGFLVRHQDEDGRFAPRAGDGTLLDHVVPTAAFVMTYAMTGSLVYRPRVQRALDRLADGIRSAEDLDTECVGWALVTLLWVRHLDREASDPRNTWLPSGLGIDEEAFARLRSWCEVRPDAADRARAVAALARIACDPITDAQARLEIIAEELAARPFSWDPERGMTDPIAGVFAAIALQFVAPSPTFTRWNRSRESTEAHQTLADPDDALCGSWNPEGLAGYEGGRVHLTALCTTIEGLRLIPYSPWRIEMVR